MTYYEAKEAKRRAEKERRTRRDTFNAIKRAAMTGDAGAVVAWNRLTAGRRVNGNAMVAGTMYSVDAKGTYRKVKG